MIMDAGSVIRAGCVVTAAGKSYKLLFSDSTKQKRNRSAYAQSCYCTDRLQGIMTDNAEAIAANWQRILRTPIGVGYDALAKWLLGKKCSKADACIIVRDAYAAEVTPNVAAVCMAILNRVPADALPTTYERYNSIAGAFVLQYWQ